MCAAGLVCIHWHNYTVAIRSQSSILCHCQHQLFICVFVRLFVCVCLIVNVYMLVECVHNLNLDIL